MSYSQTDGTISAVITVNAFGQSSQFDSEIHYSGEVDPPRPDNPGYGIIVNDAQIALNPTLLAAIGAALNDEDNEVGVTVRGSTYSLYFRLETLRIHEGCLEIEDHGRLADAIYEDFEMCWVAA